MKRNSPLNLIAVNVLTILSSFQAFAQGITYSVPECVRGVHSWQAIFGERTTITEDYSPIRERLATEAAQPSATDGTPVEIDRTRLMETALADRLPRPPAQSFDTPQSVPEPGVLALGTMGAVGLILWCPRRRLQ